MRGLTRTILVLLAMLISAVAHAEPSDKYWDNLQKSFFPGKTIEAGPFIHITAPHRAESGAQVPFAFDIDYPMTPEKYVKNVSIIVDGNPVPLTAIFHFNPNSGKAAISTRIRLEVDAYVHVVAETSDGKYYMNATTIRASGGCGGTVSGDREEAKKGAGKMKLAVKPVKAGEIAEARLLIKHPMFTGLQRDLVSMGYWPAFFVNKIEATFNGEPVMLADTFIGISEDPNIRFNFVPQQSGKLVVTIEDNEGGKFQQETDVEVL